MKTETMMTLPVALALTEAETNPKTNTAATSPTRQRRVGWLIPCVAVLAALVAYLALNNLVALDASLTALEQVMHSPQF